MKVPMSSDGILAFVSHLHTTASRMNTELQAAGNLTAPEFIEFYSGELDEDGPKPIGVVELADEIRGLLHHINPTEDYERIARFNERMRELWQQAKDDGMQWKEPLPEASTPDAAPAGTKDPISSAFGDVRTILLVVGIIWALGQAKRR